jgi:hypothetical protein
MRGSRDPPDGRWICRLIYDPVECGCAEDEVISLGLGELREIDRERISQMKTDELDRLVAAGKIREFNREHVTFIVRTIVHPPERADNYLNDVPDAAPPRAVCFR